MKPFKKPYVIMASFDTVPRLCIPKAEHLWTSGSGGQRSVHPCLHPFLMLKNGKSIEAHIVKISTYAVQCVSLYHLIGDDMWPSG